MPTATDKSNAERLLMGLPPLLSRHAHLKLGPYAQGYAHYMQAEWPGSRIPKRCPHEEWTDAWKQWHAGQGRAAVDAAESEEG